MPMDRQAPHLCFKLVMHVPRFESATQWIGLREKTYLCLVGNEGMIHNNYQ